MALSKSEEKVRIDKILVIAILFEQWRKSCNVIKLVFSDLLELEGSWKDKQSKNCTQCGSGGGGSFIAFHQEINQLNSPVLMMLWEHNTQSCFQSSIESLGDSTLSVDILIECVNAGIGKISTI